MVEILSFLYAGVGVMGVVGFIPQILTLVRATGQSKALSLQTWGIWTFGCSVSFLYSVFVLKDAVAMGVLCGNLIGTSSVFFLASYNRFIRFKDEEVVVVHMPKEQHPEQSQYQNLDVA